MGLPSEPGKGLERQMSPIQMLGVSCEMVAQQERQLMGMVDVQTQWLLCLCQRQGGSLELSGRELKGIEKGTQLQMTKLEDGGVTIRSKPAAIVVAPAGAEKLIVRG